MARVAIFSGRERRRFWSDAQKLSILNEIVSSGLGVAAVARRHDVSPQQVYGWRRHFRRKALADPTPALVPVALVDAVVMPEECSVATNSRKPVRVASCERRIEIRCLNGRVVVIDVGFDAAELKALIRAVEDA